MGVSQRVQYARRSVIIRFSESKCKGWVWGFAVFALTTQDSARKMHPL